MMCCAHKDEVSEVSLERTEKSWVGALSELNNH